VEFSLGEIGLFMKVNELFYSIQGESSFAGLPCAFIRLTGCNLRCAWCDTQYAFYDGNDMSISEITDAIAAYPTRLALVTGGEPMLQREVHELFAALIKRGYTALLETGGHEPLAEVDARVHKIMDFKCPSSGMSGRNLYANADCLTSNDEVKFVIAGRNDFDWACGIIRKYDLTARAGTVHFSPVSGKISFAELAAWILDCGLAVRMQPQLHKIIWPEISRGV
jgi:7-carboxy-7-deazaguanine synthase